MNNLYILIENPPFAEFLSEENNSLLDFVKNIDTLCANKACRNYLEKAREIMKEDLQDMVEVCPQV